MRTEENWTPCPDCDSDRVVPATYRNMAPWDSVFFTNGNWPGAEVPAAEADVAEPMADGRADNWVVRSVMQHYNDIIGIIG